MKVFDRLRDKRVAAKCVATVLCAATLVAYSGPALQYGPISLNWGIADTGFSAPAGNVDGSGKLAKNGQVQYLNSAQKKLITGLMDNWYDSLATLEANDPSHLFADDAKTQAFGNKTVLETLVGIRKLQDTDLTMSYYKYIISAQKVSQLQNGDIYVYALENCNMTFREYPDLISKSYEMEHEFVFTNTDDGWKIAHHNQIDSLYDMVMGRYMYYGSGEMKSYKKKLEATKSQMLKEAKAYVKQRRNSKNTKTALTWEHDYDRKAAVAYANKYVGTRNGSFAKYDNYGGNCQNFTSQAMYAGGIPMDWQGNRQWKWFGGTPNTAQAATGRSSSWSGVVEFLAYVNYNTGYGMVAESGHGYWTGEIGDVIHMGDSNRWRHTVMITKVMTDGNGKTKDYLISSNTADLKDFPVSAYAYSRQMVIKIYGWNGMPEVPEEDEGDADTDDETDEDWEGFVIPE